MDALDALDAVGESNVQLVRQVGSDQWDGATPCTEWNVRSLVGHLITGRHVYRGFLEGVPVAERGGAPVSNVLRSMDPSRLHHFCLAVPDLDAAVSRLLELDVPLTGGPWRYRKSASASRS